jgi:hypothetical protein
MSALNTQQLFSIEYEQELEVWLRRRFRNLCVAYIAVALIDALLIPFERSLAFSVESVMGIVMTAVSWLVTVGVIAHFLFRRRYDHLGRTEILKAATQMILILGGISLINLFSQQILQGRSGISMLAMIFMWHFSACMFLPWRPLESLQPFVPLIVLWALIVLLIDPGDQTVSFASRVFQVIFGPGVFIPGLGICAWRLQRHSEHFEQRMIGQQYLSMRQEIARARSIHESMFPRPYTDAAVRFEYVFTPMREMGGDYVYLAPATRSGVLTAVIVDVTGHGLAAALTVNRIYGELERIFAETPDSSVADVLRLLNRYVYLTMARHHIFATALAVSIDATRSKLTWASAGHPPGFLRGANGRVTDLVSTGVLLGAVGDNEFAMQQQEFDLSPDDVIVIYTDGAFEARNRVGQQFGISSLRELLSKQPAPRNWPQFVNLWRRLCVNTGRGGRRTTFWLQRSRFSARLRGNRLMRWPRHGEGEATVRETPFGDALHLRRRYAGEHDFLSHCGRCADAALAVDELAHPWCDGPAVPGATGE